MKRIILTALIQLNALAFGMNCGAVYTGEESGVITAFVMGMTYWAMVFVLWRVRNGLIDGR